MKKLFLLSVAATLISSLSFAAIRRLQYWGLPVTGVDYTTSAAAVAASAAGDTIMVYHTTNIGITIDKRLVIIGPGYWNWSGVDANFNPNLQNVQPQTAGYINITLAAGSDGTLITGCRMDITTTAASINNIKIRNCTNHNVGYWYVGTTGANLTFDNWEFSKCYLYYGIFCANIATNKVTNLKIFNCMCDGAAGGMVTLSAALGQTGIIENCSMFSSGAALALNSNGFLIQNCIFHTGVPTNYTNSVFNNCVFSYALPVTGSGNIFSAVANNLFTGYPTLGSNSFDGKFQLKAGSPAIGAGISGIDCGAYGGVNPYKLSLIPAVPAFYKLTSPGTAATANPYPITFSVRANN